MDVSSPYRSITWTVERFADTLLREMEEHRKVVGQRLRDLRKAQGMNQEDAAHAVGVAVKTWSNWERGATSPYDANWRKIADTFGVDPAEIVGTPPAPLGLGNNSAGNQQETPVLEISERIAALQNQVDAQDGKLNQILDLRHTVLDRINERLTQMEENQQVFVEAEHEVRQLMQALVGTAAELAGQVSSLEAKLAVLGSELSRLSARGSASKGRRPAAGG